MIGHVAVDIDSEYLVLYADAISVEELIRVGRFLGVIE
jgi:hypothetical protein